MIIVEPAGSAKTVTGDANESCLVRLCGVAEELKQEADAVKRATSTRLSTNSTGVTTNQEGCVGKLRRAGSRIDSSSAWDKTSGWFTRVKLTRCPLQQPRLK